MIKTFALALTLVALTGCASQTLTLSSKNNNFKILVDKSGCRVTAELKNLTNKSLSAVNTRVYVKNKKTNVAYGYYFLNCSATSPHGTAKCRVSKFVNGDAFDLGGYTCPDMELFFVN